MQCFLNGEFLPLAQARISPLDRGFLFGDGVYEVIPVYHQRPFYWQRHIARLQQSLAHIKLSYDTAGLAAIAKQLVTAIPDSKQALYIQITRGEMEKRQLAIAPASKPTVFMFSSAAAAVPAHNRSNGVSCSTVDDIRWARCDIKAVSLLGAVLLASAANADDEEVVIFRDGILSEGSRSNFIIVKNGALRVPVSSWRNLNGITYQVVCALAQAAGIATSSGDISKDELMQADEVMMTSSIREIIPVTQIDGKRIGSGKPGQLFTRLYALLQAHINSDDWHNK